jgi:uracil phosphoribosyltransferase
LQRNGSPEHVHLAALVAAPEGIQFVRENARVPMTIWTCDVDENLNDQFYIVPGLGDAGDLCFGQKL